MPPMSAAAMPRSSVSGPMCTRSAEVWSVAVSRIATVPRKPAIAHTPVDTIFGLMPVMRARSEFDAAARTASPNAVCPSSHQSPTVMTGTTISTRSWLADDLDAEPRVPRAAERHRELRLERAGAVCRAARA